MQANFTPASRLHQAWAAQLYREYDNLLYHYRLRVAPATVRLEPIGRRWGLWDPRLRTITINPALIEQYPWDVVIEVLKHEVAHQITHEQFHRVEAHGPHFLQACRMLGMASWAMRSSGDLPDKIPMWRDRALSQHEERLLKKVEKLLSLATSSNEHEALLAMQRVREIYAKYNLESVRDSQDTTHAYLLINRKRKRIEASECMIFTILVEHFFVRAVYGSLFDSQDLCEYRTVELLGTQENVVMAEYVYHFLWSTVHSLWGTYRAHSGKAAGAKRSYMLGALTGFRDKLKRDKPVAVAARSAGLSKDTCDALVATAAQRMDAYVTERHPRLVSRSWGTGRADSSSFNAGVRDGELITLNKGLATHQGNRGLLLEG